jgi:hypothetical protein
VSRNKQRSNQQLDRARDELFSHIHRCGVLQASEEHQREWLDDTIDYLAERYPELDADVLEELKQIGMRFCRPVIQRGEESSENDGQGEGETTANEAAAA